MFVSRLYLKLFWQGEKDWSNPVLFHVKVANDGIIWNMIGIKPLNMFARTIDGFMSKRFFFSISPHNVNAYNMYVLVNQCAFGGRGGHKWTQFAQWTKIIEYVFITSLQELTLCCMFIWVHFFQVLSLGG